MTQFNAFTPNTVIRSSKMNENFDNTVNLNELQKTTNKVHVPILVSSSSGAFSLDSGTIFARTLDGSNGALSLSNVAVGQVFMVALTQDGAGSKTVTWFSSLLWANGITPTLTTTAGKVDVFGFICVSSGNYLGFIIGQNL